MGLAEKRAAAEFETKVYPTLKKAIDDAAGFAIPIDVRWDTMIRQERYVKSWGEGWPKIYFTPIVNAFNKICVDDMGKTALRDLLKKIVIQDTKPSHSSQWVAFDKTTGELTLDHQFTNVNEIQSRADVLRKVLEGAM